MVTAFDKCCLIRNQDTEWENWHWRGRCFVGFYTLESHTKTTLTTKLVINKNQVLYEGRKKKNDE